MAGRRKLEGCQSDNHPKQLCRGELWQCAGCRERICYEEGCADEFFSYCDDCWAKAEFCNQCGRSVAFGNGWFVNRVPDLDTPGDRKEMGRPYPHGNWLCAECDSWCRDCGEISGRDGEA